MDSDQIPTSAKELSRLAHDVFDRLISKYQSDGNSFIDDDVQQTGLIYSSAGAVAVLLLVNTFDDVAVDSRWQDMVFIEFDRVKKHVAEKGYDATPLVSDKVTEPLFGKSEGKRYYYTDSASWVLSLGLQIRLAHRTKRFHLAADRLREWDDFLVSVNQLIKDTIEVVCEAVCPTGGWNFANGCSKPSLYYSFAMSEALADFGDYALGETPDIFGKATRKEAEDTELRKFIGGELIDRVQDSRKRLLDYLVVRYLERLGKTELVPEEVSGEYKLTEESKHLALYFSYFVIEMLVTCKLEEWSPELDETIDKAIGHGIYRSRLDFDAAYEDKNWYDDLDKSTLWLKDFWQASVSGFEEPGILPDKSKLKNLGEPGFTPLSVRCNAQYAYYVSKGPDSEMKRLFRILLEDRKRDKEELWDSKTYSILITERAIEAIVDYNDYLKFFRLRDSELSKESVFEATFREIIRSEVQTYFEESNGAKAAAAPSSAALAPTVPTLNEELLVKKLISTLATANSYAKGSDGEGLPVEKKDIKRLQDNFRDFLTNLFYESLADVYPEEQDKLRTAVPAHVQDLWVALAPWIAETQKAKLGNLFSHLADETLKSVETGRGGAKGSQK